MSDHADKIKDRLLAEDLDDDQEMLVLRSEHGVYYVHCNVLGMDVNKIPGIQTHAWGYEMNVVEFDDKPIGYYIRSVYAIAHGQDLPTWFDDDDTCKMQLERLEKLSELVELMRSLHSPYKDRINEAIIAPCVELIQNLSLQLPDGTPAILNIWIEAAESAWYSWDQVAYLVDTPVNIERSCERIKNALAIKIAQNCSWADFQHFPKYTGHYWKVAILDELKTLVHDLEVPDLEC